MTAVLSECNVDLLWFAVILNGITKYGVWPLNKKTARSAP